MILKLKNKFHQNKSNLLINNIDINKTVVSHRITFSTQDFSYFIGDKDDIKNQTLMIKRFFDNKTECMYFMIKEEKVIDKQMEIWGNLKYSKIICNS